MTVAKLIGLPDKHVDNACLTGWASIDKLAFPYNANDATSFLSCY